jgi:hypothetical protein
MFYLFPTQKSVENDKLWMLEKAVGKTSPVSYLFPARKTLCFGLQFF